MLHFWLTTLLVLIGTSAVHGLWTLWAIYVAKGQAIKTGTTTVVITLIDAYIIIEYISDSRLIIAACIGSFIGAALPVWFRNRK